MASQAKLSAVHAWRSEVNSALGHGVAGILIWEIWPLPGVDFLYECVLTSFQRLCGGRLIHMAAAPMLHMREPPVGMSPLKFLHSRVTFTVFSFTAVLLFSGFVLRVHGHLSYMRIA